MGLAVIQPVAAAAAVGLLDLTLAYRGQPAVQHLTGQFAAGSLTAVVGPNGAGKTTLLAAIAGRLRPSAGEVQIDPRWRGRMAWLPQQADVDRSFPLRVFDLVALGGWARSGSFKALDRATAAAVQTALADVGLAGFERRGIGELSVGQFQRVLFARVLLQQASLILLDEPFNAVDGRTRASLLAIVGRWHAEGRTVIAVLHDIEQVRSHFDETLLLARRCIAWGRTAQVLTADNLTRAGQLAESWDDDAATGHPAIGHAAIRRQAA